MGKYIGMYVKRMGEKFTPQKMIAFSVYYLGH